MSSLSTAQQAPKKTPKISPTFCVYPWIECSFGPSSIMRLCCYDGTYVKNKDGGMYDLNTCSPNDYWNGYGLRLIREKMLSGEKIKNCEACYYNESIGRKSLRQYENSYWLENSPHKKDVLERIEESRSNGYKVKKKPLYLDIRFGNLCNLKCRMCHPGSSSKLLSEQKELLQANPKEVSPLVDTFYLKSNQNFYSWYKDKEILKSIYQWLPSVREIYFTGGEPTLIKKNWELINFLRDKGFSKNIKLRFNINCTSAPDKLINTFKDFRRVEVYFSMDGYKEVQEYIRHPSRFEEIEKNIIKILRQRRENTFFVFTTVIQVYNILGLPRFLRWAERLQEKYGSVQPSFNMCINPDFLDISILPQNVKQLALLKLEEYQNFYKGENRKYHFKDLNAIKNALRADERKDIIKKLKEFYTYTKILDKKRGDSFKKTFPQLNTLLNKDGRWSRFSKLKTFAFPSVWKSQKIEEKIDRVF